MKSKKLIPVLISITLILIIAGCKKNVSPTAVLEDLNQTSSSPTTEIPLYPIIEEQTNTPTLYPITEEQPAPIETESPEETSTSESPLEESISFRSINMFPDGKGWGLAGRYHLLQTKDSGFTWYDVTPDSPLIPEDEYGPAVFTYFLNSGNAWYLLSDFETSKLFITTDSGTTWNESDLDFPGGYLYFLDANHGYLMSDLGAGAGSQWVAFYHTANGGLTWEQRFTHEPGVDADLPGSGIKNGMFFLDDNNGWVTASVPIEDYIYLYRTPNGGVNWEEVSVSVPVSLTGSFFEALYGNIMGLSDDGSLLFPVRVLGASDPYPLVFFQSLDSGETWTYLSTVADASKYDFTGTNVAVAAGEHTLYQSIEKGTNWYDLSANLPSDETLLQVETVSDADIWILSTPTPEDLSVIHLYRSTDSGLTWQLLPAILTASSGG